MAESAGFVAGFHDVAVIGQTIEQGGGELGIAEHAGPLGEVRLPSGDAAAGEKLANTKMGANNQACTECHGAQGNHPNADDRPKIGGQYHDYIAHALQAYRAGDRSNITMMGQAKELSDQQIADLAAYFSAQPSEINDLSHR